MEIKIGQVTFTASVSKYNPAGSDCDIVIDVNGSRVTVGALELIAAVKTLNDTCYR